VASRRLSPSFRDQERCDGPERRSRPFTTTRHRPAGRDDVISATVEINGFIPLNSIETFRMPGLDTHRHPGGRGDRGRRPGLFDTQGFLVMRVRGARQMPLIHPSTDERNRSLAQGWSERRGMKVECLGRMDRACDGDELRTRLSLLLLIHLSILLKYVNFVGFDSWCE
jgi:hypothetical protein